MLNERGTLQHSVGHDVVDLIALRQYAPEQPKRLLTAEVKVPLTKPSFGCAAIPHFVQLYWRVGLKTGHSTCVTCTFHGRLLSLLAVGCRDRR